MTPSKVRVAIIGGGIGGLTFAVALKECSDLQVDLYEQAHQITEIGAGITLWHRGYEILKSLGMKDDLVKLLNEESKDLDKQKLSFQYRFSDRKDGVEYFGLYSKGGARLFHRQEIQQMLLKHVPEFVTIHLSHQLERCEEGQDSVRLIFKDGFEATCDIVVAADGIKSVVRDSIPNDGVLPMGTNVFRGLIPREKLEKLYPDHSCLEHPTFLCGKSQYIVSFPISQGRTINVGACVTKLENEGKPLNGSGVRRSTTQEVLDLFVGWEDQAVQLIENMENPVCYALQELHPLKTYISRRIALVGDAAHGMTPYLAAGAGQAIEDAFILGRLFSEAGPENWARVFEAYNLARQPLGNKVQLDSRSQGFYLQLNAPEFENVRESRDLTHEQIEILRKSFTKHWSWLNGDVDQELTRASEFLNSAKVF
ncbi:hypothetical protein DFJ43DRAFT_1074042 [Lentinula guzmanii]|uniref:FAD-binding domain-containing protein n=3 Tax=Lentinula TaxID=5352 RepID=A0AA38MZY6_9AGAR|nr:hypothetical protein DFJ43DRAFT_1074042 [Lentinula guzmanii]KAJ3740595.1 hypothetical protein DFH05DRAFT_1509449 [Lentinula detonsa]KAJ3781143.1 hypothetical protein GGU10DRAFT_320745 [Lentinula aff. detonsa]KAJ3792993.1 hypothetical protein GGU11DRAFT_801401 [Lentinula aff. detonsa]